MEKNTPKRAAKRSLTLTSSGAAAIPAPDLLATPAYADVARHVDPKASRMPEPARNDDAMVRIYPGDLELANRCGEGQGFVIWTVLRALDTRGQGWCVDALKTIELVLGVKDGRYRLKKFATSVFNRNRDRHPSRPWEDREGRTWLRSPVEAMAELRRRHPELRIARGNARFIPRGVLFNGKPTIKRLHAAWVAAARGDRPTSH